MTAPEERLTKLADLLSECPPPDMAGGYDQCAHGTWPCVITQAAWLAQGRDRDQEVRAAWRAAFREAEAEPEARQTMDHQSGPGTASRETTDRQPTDKAG